MRRSKRGVWIHIACLFIAVGAVAVAGGIAGAADQPLQMTLYQFLVIPADGEGGEEQIVPFVGDEAVPGDVIEYQLVVTNVGETAIEDIILRLRVPAGTRYVTDAAWTDHSMMLLQFSIDGGQEFRTPPIRYFVEEEDGTRVQRVAD